MAIRRVSERERMESSELPKQTLWLAQPLDPRRRQRLSRTAPYHDAVSPELADELHRYVGMGLALVDVDENLAPGDIVQAIARYIDSKRTSTPFGEDSDARLAIACLYGHEICRHVGWGWAHVRRARRPGIIVLSPDTRYVLAPRALVDAALDTDPRGGRALGDQLELLEHPERLPKSEPGRYLRLRVR